MNLPEPDNLHDLPFPRAMPPLGLCLLDLLAAGRCADIGLDQRAHDLPAEQLARLQLASRQFLLPCGTPLEAVTWTGLQPLHDGSIAGALSERHTAFAVPPTCAIILLIAPDANQRALYFASRSPLTTTQGISGQFSAGGPFLSMLRCDLDLMGQVGISEACALPVFSASCLMPVRSRLERDVLNVLLAAQEALDREGLELSISRDLSSGTIDRVMVLDLKWPYGQETTARISCESPAGRALLANEFVCTHADLASGRLVDWLERQVRRITPVPPAEEPFAS